MNTRSIGNEPTWEGSARTYQENPSERKAPSGKGLTLPVIRWKPRTGFLLRGAAAPETHVQQCLTVARAAQGGDGRTSLDVMIHLSNQVMLEAIYRFLITQPYDHVVVRRRSSCRGFIPHVLLVDIAALTHDLLVRYPQARVLLVDDVGTDPEKLCATILAYTAYGVLPPHAGLQLVRVENGSVKALFHDARVTSAAGTVRSTIGRKPEMIQFGQRGEV